MPPATATQSLSLSSRRRSGRAVSKAARVGAPASQVVLVEDTLRNLKSAKQLGMRTVYVYHPGTPFSNQRNGRDSYVDLRINSLGDLLTGRRLLRG